MVVKPDIVESKFCLGDFLAKSPHDSVDFNAERVSVDGSTFKIDDWCDDWRDLLVESKFCVGGFLDKLFVQLKKKLTLKTVPCNVSKSIKDIFNSENLSGRLNRKNLRKLISKNFPGELYRRHFLDIYLENCPGVQEQL